MRIFTVIGARPQFIKASVVSKAIQGEGGVTETIVHTGQHFDSNMSDVFFGQLGIPRPTHQLDIHGGSHGAMTGRMLEQLEFLMLQEKPDRVMVYGDTNSTLAGALAAAKLNIPVAHVEAGLRSFNMRMPEEINRILTDQVSDVLFCPTDAAVNNLQNEGFSNKTAAIEKVGDVMQDAALLFAKKAAPPSGFDVPGDFILATLHRAENTDDPDRLENIVAALNEIHASDIPVVLPLHPRTKAAIEKHGLKLNVFLIDPVGYFEMVWLLDHCRLVLTDSGGVQKEAYFFSKPCVTMREQTEWVELIDAGVNMLAGACKQLIEAGVQSKLTESVVASGDLYGGGQASSRIVRSLIDHSSRVSGLG